MKKMFAQQIRKTLEVYVDDTLVKSVRVEDHLTYLTKMFDVLFVYRMKLNTNKCAFRVSTGKFLRFTVNHREIKANLDKIRTVLKMKAP